MKNKMYIHIEFHNKDVAAPDLDRVIVNLKTKQSCFAAKLLFTESGPSEPRQYYILSLAKDIEPGRDQFDIIHCILGEIYLTLSKKLTHKIVSAKDQPWHSVNLI